MLYPSHQGAQDGRLAVPSQQHYGPGQQAVSTSAINSFVTYAKAIQDLDKKTQTRQLALTTSVSDTLKPAKLPLLEERCAPALVPD